MLHSADHNHLSSPFTFCKYCAWNFGVVVDIFWGYFTNFVPAFFSSGSFCTYKVKMKLAYQKIQIDGMLQGNKFA